MRTKTIIAIFILLACTRLTSIAQISFYKIQDGVKTLLKESDAQTITFNEEFIPDFNILVEIDVKKFKAAYKYENFRVSLVRTTEKDKSPYTISSHSFTFDNNVNVKKYGDDKTLSFFLFQTDDVKSNNKYMSLHENKVSYYYNNYSLSLVVEGRYRERVEEYYEDHAFKTRDILSKAEFLSQSPTINLVASKKAQLNNDYKELITNGNGSIDGVEGVKNIYNLLAKEWKSISEMKTTVLMVSSENFPNIPDAIEEIEKDRSSKIKSETDYSKAIDLLKAWNNEYSHLMVSGLDKKVLKDLNKDLKGANDIEAKMDLFKKYKP